MMLSRKLRRRLIWTALACVLLLLAALGVSLRVAETVASATRRVI